MSRRLLRRRTESKRVQPGLGGGQRVEIQRRGDRERGAVAVGGAQRRTSDREE